MHRRCRVRSSANNRPASSACRGARPSCIGMSSRSSRNHGTPASRSGRSFPRIAARSASDSYTTSRPGEIAKPKRAPCRVGVRGELAEARQLAGAVGHPPIRSMLRVVLRCVDVRVEPARREERDRIESRRVRPRRAVEPLDDAANGERPAHRPSVRRHRRRSGPLSECDVVKIAGPPPIAAPTFAGYAPAPAGRTPP